MTNIDEFTVRDEEEIRDQILTDIRMGLILNAGVTNPNVAPGSDYHVTATALARELAVVEANAVIKADDMMPDTSTGDELEARCSPYGLTRRAAGGSIGYVTIESSAATTISTGAQLLDSAGLSFEVIAGGSFVNGDTVQVQGISTGRATNHAEDDVLRWISAPPYCSETVTVASGGLTNGVDAEDDETLRARLFAYLSVPPTSGNWEHVATMAEESAPSVQKAFIYPAIQGPATVHVAVTAAPTTTSKSRVVAATTVNNIVDPYVKGKYPEHVHIVTTGVLDRPVEVSIGLTLPSASTASPPGPGGGWLDGTPWPAHATSGNGIDACEVLAVTSTTVMTVYATTAPTIGVSRIAWLSPTDWTLYTATVVGLSGTSGAYVITIDKPFVGIVAGSYIWPQFVAQQEVVDAVLAFFALMGPGEKTSNASALVRGYRHPVPSTSWPASVNATMLRAVTDASDSVQDAAFVCRRDSTSLVTVLGAAGAFTPIVAASLTAAPYQYIPKHIGFYPNT